MTIKCDQCGEAAHKKVGHYRYNESGLDNVYLENIPIYECFCGASFPSIFRLHRLNELIASTLLKKLALLSGNEIKFLRKNLHVPSKLFAQKLGVDKTTLSKWENEAQKHSEGFDRLIRMTYIIEKGINRQEQLNIQKQLGGIRLRKSSTDLVIIAEKVKNGYTIRYRPVIESRSERFSLIDAFDTLKDRSITAINTILGFRVFAENGETDVQQKPPLVRTDASLIPKGIELYATQTAEI